MSNFQDANNSNAVFPVVLIIHSNISMGGSPIKNINDNLASFFENLSKYNLTHGKVETCVITVTDETKIIKDWSMIDETPIKLPNIFADGAEDLTDAFRLSLDMIQDKCTKYDSMGIEHHTPAIVLISDDVFFSDSDLEATVESLVSENKLNLFLLLVNDDVAPAVCAKKNAYTVDSSDPYNFVGFFKLIENAVKSTVPYSADKQIDYTDLLDEIWESLPIKKIF